MNNENHPATEYKPEWENNDFVREFIALHDQIGIRRLNSGIDIKLDDFKTSNCFWALDLSADLCNNAHTHLAHTGTIGVEITFKKELSESFQMIEYGVFHTALVIDKDRICTLVDNI